MKIRYLVFLLAFAACQDDPQLEELENGVPVITPKSKAFITSIQVNTFPSLDQNGETWDTLNATEDPNGLPDVFFNITDPSPDPPILWSQPSHFLNVAPGDTTPYFLITQHEIVPFGAYINLNLYDYELPDSTLMGTLSFFTGEYPDPDQPNIIYPSYITSSANGFSATIGIRWED